jgi:Nucleotidyl transferase AbiEii toxin, Type IV TA system
MAAPKGLPVSIQTRLVRHAKEIGVDPNLVLTRYATERILYRLSRSAHAERFVLKGALLMLVWLGETIRPTRDADLLGFGDLSEQSLASIFRALCAADVESDGLQYLSSSIRVAPIRAEDWYGGLRAPGTQADSGKSSGHVGCKLEVVGGTRCLAPPAHNTRGVARSLRRSLCSEGNVNCAESGRHQDCLAYDPRGFGSGLRGSWRSTADRMI